MEQWSSIQTMKLMAGHYISLSLNGNKLYNRQKIQLLIGQTVYDATLKVIKRHHLSIAGADYCSYHDDITAFIALGGERVEVIIKKGMKARKKS